MIDARAQPTPIADVGGSVAVLSAENEVEQRRSVPDAPTGLNMAQTGEANGAQLTF